ncbi:Fc receptor-like protein [Sarotherodon galilaeus]
MHYSAARSELKRGIRVAKAAYKRRIEDYFSNNNSRQYIQRLQLSRPATYPPRPLYLTPRAGEGIGPDHRCPMHQPSDGEVSTLAVGRASSGSPGAGLMATHMARSSGAAGMEVSWGSQTAGQTASTQDHAACVPKRTACRLQAWQDSRAPRPPWLTPSLALSTLTVITWLL